jgi:asparagine synthase (glutamine-hydrolysing)
MCGIAGIFCKEKVDPETALEEVTAMINVLAHRGPDGEGIWSDRSGRVFLGHRRLAIIDLSPAGAQPMVMGDREYALIFNGEIYNYLELRKELEDEKHKFVSQSDTEVLLCALRVLGLEKTLSRLVGMYAFAYWDGRAGKLSLVRDRIGKKPLYYIRERDRLYFASETKAFKRLERVSLALCEESISHYLSLGYIPSPLTVYSNVLEVPPGTAIVFDGNLRESMKRYWIFPTSSKREVSFSAAVEEAGVLLAESVKLRLRSDVPAGIFLSGGIDSGLITALAASFSTKPLKTFTIRFAEQSFDESPLAAQVAQRYGTEHRNILLSAKFDELLPEVVRAYDEPFADPSALPTFLVAKAAREHVKVVLSGEGGDELFGGYRRHLASAYYDAVSPLIRLIMSGQVVRKTLQYFLPPAKKPRTVYSFLVRFIRGLDPDPYMRYLLWGSDGFSEREKLGLYIPTTRLYPSTTDFLAQRHPYLDGADPVEHFMALDLSLGLSDCLLFKLDIASMHHGLESRCPFLDHRLIDWARRLPARILLSGNKNKAVLRDLARRYLPSEVVQAPKRGFEIPLLEWMKGPFFGAAYDFCLDSRGIILKLFNKKQVEDLILRRIPIDNERWAKRMWILLVLALWDSFERVGIHSVRTSSGPKTIQSCPTQS